MLTKTGENRILADLNSRDFLRIAEVMQQEAGIYIPESKLPLVQARLLRRLRLLELNSYSEYCAMVEKSENTSERLKMVSALTTNVTSFFRENHHFEYLRNSCMEILISRLKAGNSVRVWSAGCSTGEEPYSLALSFLEAIPDISRYDFRLLASDIDPIVLRTAAEGIYADTALTGVSESSRKAHFEVVEGSNGLCRVRKPVKDLVSFRRLNLIAEWPMKRSFDIIMCRNVVIYFGEQTKAGIWDRLVSQLRSDGTLFTGHSERLSGPATNKVKLVGTTTYRVNSGNELPERTTLCH